MPWGNCQREAGPAHYTMLGSSKTSIYYRIQVSLSLIKHSLEDLNERTGLIVSKK